MTQLPEHEHDYVAPDAPATDSIVGMLAQRRKEILDSEVFTFVVPRWKNPQVAVEFRIVPHAEVGRVVRAGERAANRKMNDEEASKVELDLNTDLLIRASLNVRINTEDGKSHSLGPIGSPSVADALGLPQETPTRLVAQQLFIADGDLMRCARALGEWSGYRFSDADEVIQGE